MPLEKKRVFSGIQPTGNIHLGNYLGAIKNWVQSQEQYENIFCIVNAHAITTKQDPHLLKQMTYNLAAMLLACGIDPKKSILFIQSEVNEHACLAWILDCFIPMGEMSRMTQFKDKSQKNAHNINVGLFNYPALMAADILLYDTDYVPVGEDQQQHIELTRNVALKFNTEYKTVFKLPEALIPKQGARIMSLSDPEKKMSKSDTKPHSIISLLDSPDEIFAKFKRSTTDSLNSISFNKEQKGVYNLLSIYQLLSQKTKEDIEKEFFNVGYGELKKRVAQVVVEYFAPIQENYYKLQKEQDYLHSILTEGANKAREIASHRYSIIKECVGLL